MFTLRLYFTCVFRLGWCSQPMAKQSALPLTVWYLRVEVVVLAMTGWRSMRAPPPSATADLIGVNITVEMKTTLSVLAPPSLDPSRAPPSQSSSTLVSGSLQVGSWRLSAAQHMLPQIWLMVSLYIFYMSVTDFYHNFYISSLHHDTFTCPYHHTTSSHHHLQWQHQHLHLRPAQQTDQDCRWTGDWSEWVPLAGETMK